MSSLCVPQNIVYRLIPRVSICVHNSIVHEVSTRYRTRFLTLSFLMVCCATPLASGETKTRDGSVDVQGGVKVSSWKSDMTLLSCLYVTLNRGWLGAEREVGSRDRH